MENGFSIGALVTGILGLFIPLLSIVAIILGIIALSKKQSKGLAIAGLILGILSVLIYAGALLYFSLLNPVNYLPVN